MKSPCRLVIDALAYGGEAVGRLESGEVCFVRGALPGETAELEITARKKRFVRGKLLRIITPSPHRRTAACPCAADCPGCAFQHCDYALELEWKERQFQHFLRDFPGTREPIYPSPFRLAWRNRLTLHCEKGRPGYRGFDNTSLIPIEKCLLAGPEINGCLAHTPVPETGELFFRSTPFGTGAVRKKGEALLTEILPGVGAFQVPEGGFFQTNIPVASELCSQVSAVLTENGVRSLLELFCGVGVFSIAAAKQLPELRSVGIEADRQAIKAARLNALRSGVEDRCRFFAADARDFRPGAYDAVLVDPPRTGISEALVKKLLESAIPLLLYVSCGPDTLRRDLKRLEGNYRVIRSGAFDMFPCTAHFETFTILTLSNPHS